MWFEGRWPGAVGDFVSGRPRGGRLRDDAGGQQDHRERKLFLIDQGVIEVTATDTNTYLHLQTHTGHYVWELHPVCGPDGDTGWPWSDTMLGVWRD